MKLSKKTFLYAITFVTVLLALIICYFAFLLPSLYVNYMKTSNCDKLVEIQKEFVKKRNYESIAVKNPTSTYSFVIPQKEYTIKVCNKLVSFNLTIEDKTFMKKLDQMRQYVREYNQTGELKKSKENRVSNDGDIVESLLKMIKKVENSEINSAVKITNLEIENHNPIKELSIQYKAVNKSTMITQWEGTDGENYFTNYIAFSYNKDDFVVSFLTTMTPKMTEIQPIILQSLPMIIVVTVLLVLIVTAILTRKIVAPIQKLADHACYVRQSGNLAQELEIAKGTDEIAVLSQSLNLLYCEVSKNNKELENKNQQLSEQNTRQEVFLRSSSHQLKTPITAALLLIDSMIQKVGKYHDTEVYLPEVKAQVLSMKKIVDDILYLRHCEDDMKIESFQLNKIVDDVLTQFKIQMNEKQVYVNSTYSTSKVDKRVVITGDSDMVKKIIENLVSNAISYCNPRSEIQILYKEHVFIIKNQCSGIESSILPIIFEPFVTSNHTEKGHGLGLYVVNYYCKLLDYQVKIYNTDDGVEVKIEFV